MRCRSCDETKADDEMVSKGDGLRDNVCKPCAAERMRAWKYGMDVPTLRELLKRGCEACGATDDLQVDHDHACCPGKKSCGACVRGVLCGGCNRALAHLGDDPRRLVRLADYLLAEWE